MWREAQADESEIDQGKRKMLGGRAFWRRETGKREVNQMDKEAALREELPISGALRCEGKSAGETDLDEAVRVGGKQSLGFHYHQMVLSLLDRMQD